MPELKPLSNNFEQQRIKKNKTILTNDYYKSPLTSLLIFQFEPHKFESSQLRMKKCLAAHASVENKDLYLFDQFFEHAGKDELRNFFGNATYSRGSYGTAESMEKGEKPAYSMNTKERWNLFSSPPPAVQEIHKLLSFFAYQLDAEITTMPWELCHPTTGSPALNPSVIVNYHNEGISKESMKYGMHQDCKPEKGIFFGIPVLYKKNDEFHESHFVNGSPGKPWLVSLMLYSASKDFTPDYGMGTVFYTPDGEVVGTANCVDGRIVLFEGDIFHSPEESKIPPDKKPWRISYVLKLIVNPRHEQQCLKKSFLDLINNSSHSINKLNLGVNSRF